MIVSPRGRTARGNVLAAGHHEKQGPENHEEARNDPGETHSTFIKGRLDHYNRVGPNQLVATPHGASRRRSGIRNPHKGWTSKRGPVITSMPARTADES